MIEAAFPINNISQEELAALTAIMEDTTHTTGEAFFQSLVTNLSTATDIPNVFIGNQVWDLDGTP